MPIVRVSIGRDRLDALDSLEVDLRLHFLTFRCDGHLGAHFPKRTSGLCGVEECPYWDGSRSA